MLSGLCTIVVVVQITGGMYSAGALERFNDDIMAVVRGCDGSKPCPPPSTPRGVAGLLSVDGPLWTRDVSEGAEATICPQVDALLHAIGAERIVVGHTIQARLLLLLPLSFKKKKKAAAAVGACCRTTLDSVPLIRAAAEPPDNFN